MTNVIDFQEAVTRLKSQKQNNEQETFSVDEVFEHNFADEYCKFLDDVLWFFFLLVEDEDFETWNPPLQVKMLMVILDGVIFNMLGEMKAPESLFVQDIIEKMGVQDMEEINL